MHSPTACFWSFVELVILLVGSAVVQLRAERLVNGLTHHMTLFTERVWNQDQPQQTQLLQGLLEAQQELARQLARQGELLSGKCAGAQ